MHDALNPCQLGVTIVLLDLQESPRTINHVSAVSSLSCWSQCAAQVPVVRAATSWNYSLRLGAPAGGNVLGSETVGLGLVFSILLDGLHLRRESRCHHTWAGARVHTSKALCHGGAETDAGV